MTTKRLKVFTGSLRTPLYQYVTEARVLFYEEKNPEATHFVRKYVEMCRKFDKKRYVEDYRWYLDVKKWPENDVDNSFVQYKFVDGSEMKASLEKPPDWGDFVEYLTWKRKVIENQRMILGFDDDLPDDEHA
mmetsp:Transcript_31729/g.54836  ORF Transcript_31729/g.54836 Transcript_31729/m.54836 type:complete len:132 (-) Transcript_31729:50-445(-)